MSAPGYERTTTWGSTLARRVGDPDDAARERLRAGYRRMRDKASTIAGEIGRDLPNLTVHDVTHLDALWELVDLVGGEDLNLTPCEAFVLGGAILTHDLGMTAAAYPGGREQLRQEARWKDTLARLMRRKGIAYCATDAPPEEIAVQTDQEVLRLLHADKALEIPGQSWSDGRGHDHRFMEDDELREGFAQLIGRIASSHWWPTTKLLEAFGEPIGAPAWCPPQWKIDPLRVACLLRVADAAHIDARRAPAFLHVLRRPSGIADHHWLFQRRLQRATLHGEQLKFSSAVAFKAVEAPAWWEAVKALRMIDGELRAVDALLLATDRARLAARRVAGSDNLEALQKHVAVDGWRPVDTRVRISDIPGLIERLGGRRLYGNDGDAPLRELIQNSADAVRARRIFERRPSDWGSICVVRDEDESGPWIEVRDDGLGMSEALLVGPLLDFGVSYWDSELSCEEFPGLMASGFRSVGEFGIGFFSVFMWGSRVKVTTRSCRSATTLVLEFERGVASPPLLRTASDDEHLVDPGTTVRVWMAEEDRQLLYSLSSNLTDRCERLCPTLDVSLYVHDAGATQPVCVIVAQDWLNLEPDAFLRRLTGPNQNGLGSALSELRVGDDELELDRVLALIEPIVDPDSQQVVGRGCLRPPWLSRYGGSTLVTRGLRLGWKTMDEPTLGVLEGVPSKAARDEGLVSVTPEALQAWYRGQEAKVAATFEGYSAFEFAGVLAPVLDGPVTKLPVLWGTRGWTLREIAKHTSLPDVIILVFPGVFGESDSAAGRVRARPVADLPKHVYTLCHRWPIDLEESENNNNTTLMLLLGCIASAWGVSHPTKMLVNSRLTRRVKGELRPAVPKDKFWGGYLHVLRRPGSSDESATAAYKEFYEYATKHPYQVHRNQIKFAEVGGMIMDLSKKKMAQRQKKY